MRWLSEIIQAPQVSPEEKWALIDRKLVEGPTSVRVGRIPGLSQLNASSSFIESANDIFQSKNIANIRINDSEAKYIRNYQKWHSSPPWCERPSTCVFQ